MDDGVVILKTKSFPEDGDGYEYRVRYETDVNSVYGNLGKGFDYIPNVEYLLEHYFQLDVYTDLDLALEEAYSLSYDHVTETENGICIITVYEEDNFLELVA